MLDDTGSQAAWRAVLGHQISCISDLSFEIVVAFMFCQFDFKMPLYAHFEGILWGLPHARGKRKCQ